MEGKSLKYELTAEGFEYEGHYLRRIRALKNFGRVKAGDVCAKREVVDKIVGSRR